MRRLAVTAVAAAAVAIAPVAGAATPEAAFGLRAVGADAAAGYFVYTTAAGTSRTGTVIVSNSGTATGTVNLSTADASTGSTTGTIYLTDTPPQSTGAWITLGKTSVTLAPGKSARVPFTVKVPAGTPVGQHVGGIVAEATSQPGGTSGKGKTSVRIKIRNQSIMAVQVDVPGAAIHRFTIGKVTTGGANGFQQVIVRVANRGNVLERPTGAVTIYDGSGKLVQTLRFAMDTFLPQTSIDFPIELKKALPAGTYAAAVTLHYALGSPTGIRTATERPSFKVTPQDVQKVFTTATPTLAAPTTATPTTTGSAAATTTTTSSATSSGSSGGTSTVVYIVVAAVAAVLLLLLLFVLLRRRRGPAAVITIPAPMPRPPAPASLPTAPPPAAPPLESAPPAAAPPTAPPAAEAPAAEPAPADETPDAVPAPQPEPPVEPPPAPEPVPEPQPAAPPAPPAPICEPYHYWEVDYDHGVQGADGVWRFPHRCKNCGIEILARDVTDASEQASDRT